MLAEEFCNQGLSFNFRFLIIAQSWQIWETHIVMSLGLYLWSFPFLLSTHINLQTLRQIDMNSKYSQYHCLDGWCSSLMNYFMV